MSNVYSIKNSILILIILLTNSIFAQNDSIIKSKALPPFETVDYVYKIISSLNLPEEKATILPNENITFNLSFFVSNEGKVNNVRIKNDSYEMSSYFENAMKNLPNWTPAKINGDVKSSREQLAIQLNLKDKENTKAKPEIGINGLYKEFISKFKITKSNISMLYKLGYDVNNAFTLKLVCKITIESNGNLTNLTIHDNKLYFLENQILEILKEFKWVSATENGKPINSELTLPMTIKYSDKTK